MADDTREQSDYELDSDGDEMHGDGDELGNWLGQLQSLTSSLEATNFDHKTSPQSKLTPSLAIESFRSSFLLTDSGGGDEEIDLDAILGELCEIENQLKKQNNDLSSVDTIMPTSIESLDDVIDKMDSPSVTETLDSKSKTQAWINSTPPLEQMSRPEQWKRQSQASQASSSSSASHKSQPLSDVDRDSAYLENESLPSSESYLSVSSSNQSSSRGSPHIHSTASNGHNVNDREISQANKIKEEKIKIALEKIKDTKLERLFIRAFSDDGSSKAILVDERMNVRRVWQLLIDKNHSIPDLNLAVVEQLPSLYMERVLEDHDSLVEVKLTWPRDSTNRIMFTKRAIKYDLFRCPEAFLLGESYADRGASLDRNARTTLLEEFFASNQVPEVEGMLHLKTEGKKVWKKVFCVLRASGIYYNPKGKSKSSRDLTSLVQFDTEELYLGVGWKKKYKSPTDFTFALKHPCVMKKASKYIKYFCADDEMSWRRWLNGIRVAKHGHVIYDNYRENCCDVQMWDTRVAPTMTSQDGTTGSVKVTTSLQRRESLPASPRHRKLEQQSAAAHPRRASANCDNERQLSAGAEPTRYCAPDAAPIANDTGHDSGHESSESLGPGRQRGLPLCALEDGGTLKKPSSRVPILPVTTDTAKSLTLKRTDYVPTQRATILNGEMTIQRCRKMSDGDIAVKNWRQSRSSDEHNISFEQTNGHLRMASYTDEFQHYRRKSLESDSILRDSPPRDLARSDTLRADCARADPLRNSVVSRAGTMSPRMYARENTQPRSNIRSAAEREPAPMSDVLPPPPRAQQHHLAATIGDDAVLPPPDQFQESLYDEPCSLRRDSETATDSEPELHAEIKNALPPPMAPLSLPQHLETKAPTDKRVAPRQSSLPAPQQLPFLSELTEKSNSSQMRRDSTGDRRENPYAAICAASHKRTSSDGPYDRPPLMKSSTYDAVPPPLPPANRTASPGAPPPPTAAKTPARMTVPPPAPPPTPARTLGPPPAPPTAARTPGPPTKPKMAPSRSLGSSSDEPLYSLPPETDLCDEIDCLPLPPPPPELLEGLDMADLPQVPCPMPELNIGQNDPSPCKRKLPPPPPKRSITTQLSTGTNRV